MNLYTYTVPHPNIFGTHYFVKVSEWMVIRNPPWWKLTVGKSLMFDLFTQGYLYLVTIFCFWRIWKLFGKYLVSTKNIHGNDIAQTAFFWRGSLYHSSGTKLALFRFIYFFRINFKTKFRSLLRESFIHQMLMTELQDLL